MWTIFKIVNLVYLLASTFVWIFLEIPQLPLVFFVNFVMLISLSFLPIRYKMDGKSGLVLLSILCLTLWSMWIDGWSTGLTTALQYLPALYLMQLPNEYLKDLLKFVTKWYAILLIPALLLYWASLFTSLPSLGTFDHDGYLPFKNYFFYIEMTFDEFRMARFNAFFLEPGHQAIVSTFLMMANRFDFKRCPWLIILAIAVVFSISLAGYLLFAIGFVLLKVDNLKKGIITAVLFGSIIGGGLLWSGGDNTLNEMILSRMEYDKSSGIKGNNRFFNNTDFEYKQSIGTRYFWTGIKGKSNMELISGAGYKIYILYYGMIGVLAALFFYLSVIPSRPDYRFSISFFIVLTLCFIQRAYPNWYAWYFPYVVGMYIAKYEKEIRLSIKSRQTRQLQ